MKRTTLAIVSIALMTLGLEAYPQGAATSMVDVVGQGSDGPVVSADGATIIRSPKGISASLRMPTPVPGSYDYPVPNQYQTMVLVGHPEVFTGWIFIFNNPAACSDPCNGDDLGPTPARGGAYNFAGHAVGLGSTLNLSGHVSVGDTPFAGVPLDNPTAAEVHLAVAPHGMLLPELLPTQITHPIGSPAEWWLAIFLP